MWDKPLWMDWETSTNFFDKPFIEPDFLIAVKKCKIPFIFRHSSPTFKFVDRILCGFQQTKR